jgi:hypothetical protein
LFELTSTSVPIANKYKKPPSATQREEILREVTEVVIMTEIAGGGGGVGSANYSVRKIIKQQSKMKKTEI